MTDLLLLICGLLGLWAGSDLLVRGAMMLVARYGVTDAVFGMVVLAIGTDLPELFVMLGASLRSLGGEDQSSIVIGSAVGSAIGQFGLAIGVAGLIGYRAMPRTRFSRNAAFLLGALAALYVVGSDGLITRAEGSLLAAGFVMCLYRLIRDQARAPPPQRPAASESHIRAWAFLLAGLATLLVAAELTVVYAGRFADTVGLSEVAVSAIIIGMGSSLPELSVSLIALFHKRGGLSVGNLIGSNLLDTLLVPGLGATLSPIVVPVAVLQVDLALLLVLTMLVLGFLFLSRRGVRKPEAIVLLAIYALYVALRLNDVGIQVT